MGRSVSVAVVGSLLAVALLGGAGQPAAQSALRVTARRLPENPLITTRTSPALGDNINGPTVIRVPKWVKQPSGRYYMYFAHHMGASIRLAYADRRRAVAGSRARRDARLARTAFFRPQPDPPENLENFYTHVASPEIYVDEGRQRLVLWFHGWWTQTASAGRLTGGGARVGQAKGIRPVHAGRESRATGCTSTFVRRSPGRATCVCSGSATLLRHGAARPAPSCDQIRGGASPPAAIHSGTVPTRTVSGT